MYLKLKTTCEMLLQDYVLLNKMVFFKHFLAKLHQMLGRSTLTFLALPKTLSERVPGFG
jgi:hypothetical protein